MFTYQVIALLEFMCIFGFGGVTTSAVCMFCEVTTSDLCIFNEVTTSGLRLFNEVATSVFWALQGPFGSYTLGYRRQSRHRGRSTS